MNFLVDINPKKPLPEYELVLCKMNEEKIMTINNIVNLKHDGNFANIDELSFDIPLYRMESNGQQVENERYHAIKGDMLILVNHQKAVSVAAPQDGEFFYIHYVREKVGENGAILKEVQAYSRQYELSQKRIVGYQGVSRVMYTPVAEGVEPPKDENGLEEGFMNYIEKITSWRVSTVAESIKDKYRTIDLANTNVLQAFQEVQKAFGCLFIFDTKNKTIEVTEIESFDSDKGLYISDRNFLKTLESSIKFDEIKTRLYLYGKDNISIQTLGITGKPYIENYDIYRNTDYMSPELLSALDAYYIGMDAKEGDYNDILLELEQKQDALSALNIQVVEDYTALRVIQSNIDIGILAGTPITSLRENERALTAAIKIKEDSITDLINDLIVIHEDLEILAKEIDVSEYLTPDLVKEFDSFIKEETFTDAHYTEENLEELLEEGYKILNRISQPAIQFNVSVVDFLRLVEYQHIWDKFVLGDKVRLFHKDLNFDFSVRLVGFTHEPDNHNLTLKFSSADTMDDPNLYLRDILDGLKTTSSSVDFSKYKWDKGEQADLAIAKYVSENLNLAKQSIVTATGQKPVLDDRGYWGYTLNPDGTINKVQMRMTNNVIAMTKDDWSTVDVAISAEDGINATLLNGKIGNLATLNADQVNVGSGDNPPNLNDELIRIEQETQDKINDVNTEISDVDGKINGLENFTNTAFKDGILDMAEKESLLVHIQQLNNEKSDVDAKYTSIYADLNLIGTPKSSLLTTKNNYNTSHGTLLTTINDITGDDKITEAEKTLINNAFIDYRAKLSALSTAFENAIRAIESKKAEVIANDLIVNFNTNILVPAISGVQTQIDGKIESWNQETDPSTAWNTADLKLKHTGDMWYKPSTKELKRYSGSAWILIEDKQAIDAYALANTKRTIFTTQPTIPYVIGDLWKVSGIAGIDFKICIISRSSGNYLASEWVNVNDSKSYIDTQRTELNTSIAGLNTTISTAFSDNSITNIEAQSISLSRDSVVKEANDIKAIAVSLLVSTTSLDTSINDLNTEVDKYVGKTTYPRPVTATDRTALANAFTGLEGAITQLYKNIDEKRLANTSSSLTGIINGIQTDLQTQIDGKIDTWFYAVAPTLSNAPASSWTTNAIKDKHIDDLYYDTVKGFAYRFTKVSTTYSWSRIMDSDITKALSDASVAKATADGKMTVYLVQPTTPYHKGDLWRETANATDLKICTTTRLTGNYVAGDWSNATNVGGALSDLGNQIGDFSSDLKLTLAEANGLKMSLESSTSESTELIATASALSITTERTNYSSALTTLTNELNANWLNKTYPWTITVAQRTTVTNYFKDLEGKKSILLTKITEERAKKEAKDYTDANALKQDFEYNRTKITQAEGVEVFNNLGNRVLQMGGIATGTTQTKNDYGFKATHTDGSFTALTRSGLIRRINGVDKPYNYLVHLDPIYYEFAVNSSQAVGAMESYYINNHIVTLPNDFKGKNFQVFSTMGSFSANHRFAVTKAEGYIKLNGIDYINAKITMEIGMNVIRVSSGTPNSTAHWIEVGLLAIV